MEYIFSKFVNYGTEKLTDSEARRKLKELLRRPVSEYTETEIEFIENFKWWNTCVSENGKFALIEGTIIEKLGLFSSELRKRELLPGISGCPIQGSCYIENERVLTRLEIFDKQFHPVIAKDINPIRFEIIKNEKNKLTFSLAQDYYYNDHDKFIKLISKNIAELNAAELEFIKTYHWQNPKFNQTINPFPNIQIDINSFIKQRLADHPNLTKADITLDHYGEIVKEDELKIFIRAIDITTGKVLPEGLICCHIKKTETGFVLLDHQKNSYLNSKERINKLIFKPVNKMTPEDIEFINNYVWTDTFKNIKGDIRVFYNLNLRKVNEYLHYLKNKNFIERAEEIIGRQMDFRTELDPETKKLFFYFRPYARNDLREARYHFEPQASGKILYDLAEIETLLFEQKYTKLEKAYLKDYEYFIDIVRASESFSLFGYQVYIKSLIKAFKEDYDLEEEEQLLAQCLWLGKKNNVIKIIIAILFENKQEIDHPLNKFVYELEVDHNTKKIVKFRQTHSFSTSIKEKVSMIFKKSFSNITSEEKNFIKESSWSLSLTKNLYLSILTGVQKISCQEEYSYLQKRYGITTPQEVSINCFPDLINKERVIFLEFTNKNNKKQLVLPYPLSIKVINTGDSVSLKKEKDLKTASFEIAEKFLKKNLSAMEKDTINTTILYKSIVYGDENIVTLRGFQRFNLNHILKYYEKLGAIKKDEQVTIMFQGHFDQKKHCSGFLLQLYDPQRQQPLLTAQKPFLLTGQKRSAPIKLVCADQRLLDAEKHVFKLIQTKEPCYLKPIEQNSINNFHKDLKVFKSKDYRYQINGAVFRLKFIVNYLAEAGLLNISDPKNGVPIRIKTELDLIQNKYIVKIGVLDTLTNDYIDVFYNPARYDLRPEGNGTIACYLAEDYSVNKEKHLYNIICKPANLRTAKEKYFAKEYKLIRKINSLRCEIKPLFGLGIKKGLSRYIRNLVKSGHLNQVLGTSYLIKADLENEKIIIYFYDDSCKIIEDEQRKLELTILKKDRNLIPIGYQIIEQNLTENIEVEYYDEYHDEYDNEEIEEKIADIQRKNYDLIKNRKEFVYPGKKVSYIDPSPLEDYKILKGTILSFDGNFAIIKENQLQVPYGLIAETAKEAEQTREILLFSGNGYKQKFRKNIGTSNFDD